MPELNDALADMICKIWTVLKAADAELEAYKIAKTFIGKAYPEAVESLNAYVTSQRQSAALQEKMNQKYALILETLLRQLPGDLPRTSQVLERLQKLENL